MNEKLEFIPDMQLGMNVESKNDWYILDAIKYPNDPWNSSLLPLENGTNTVDKNLVNNMEAITFMIIPDENYQLDSLLMNNEVVTVFDTSYQLQSKFSS